MTTLDQMKAIGDLLMRAAQTNLTEHGDLIPVVAIVDNGEMTKIVGIGDIADNRRKRAAYLKMAIVLAQLKPDAVVMINDSYMKHLEAKDVDHYKPGDLSMDHEAQEAIMVAFKGPAVEPHLLCAPYTRNPVGDIVFGEIKNWARDCQMNLLPNWWRSK